MSKLVPISGNKLCKILFLLPLLLPTANLFAQTPVGGFISTNTTWNLAGSPYIVTGQNIIVSSGVTLTIDAGVTVKFDSTRSIQIDGTLRAIGTAAQPILITSNTVSPQPGDWGFILFNSNSAAYNFSTGTGSILQYCTIEYAGGVTVSNNAALRLDNAIPYINNCTIRYNTKPGIKGWNYTKTLRIDSCTIQNNTVDTGSVTIRGASAAATAILTGCTITNNTSTLPSNNIYKVAGYFGNNLNNRIKNCTISNNNQYGIFIMSASNLKDTITGNSITNNTGNGIYYYYSLSIFNNFNNHTISNNTITGNTGNGIFFSFSFVFYSNTYTISNNIISKNQGSGIYYYSNPNNQNLTPNTLTIQKNKIVNNQSNKGAGIYIYTNNFTRVNPNITQNVIAGNKATQEGGGVYMDIQNETNNVFQYNSLINNYAPNSSAFWYKGAGVLQANKNTIVWNKTTGAAPTRAVYIGAYPASTNMTLNNNNIYNSHCNSPFYDFWFAGANSDSINARNTYWQQSTLTDVNNVIYDYLDTSTLGRVNFNPFLMLPDTSAPVTPVQNVTKTQAGSDVQLTWSANLETDIAGYKIYWGNPTGYSFSNVIDVGNVTSYALSGVSATDTIEVTAYDTQADITSTRTSAAAFLIIGSGVTYLMDNTPVTTNNGAFYDSGGPSGNYSNNENYTKTFTPVISGSMLQFTFTSFLVYGNDTLKIYDGPNTSYPVIGIFSGTTSPGIITATNPTGQITFQWTSNASTVSAGWAATISCIYPSTTCIISQPSDQIVSAGGSAIFNVGTGASVPLTYQWQVNTGSGWNNITSAGSNPAYFGWNTATLNLSGIVAGNNGYQYRCIVDNACTCGEQLSGNESWFKGDDPTVFVPIALSSNPSNATICAGQSITFTASGANTYQFFVNGVSQQGP
ncbi:MAG: right-handed parallel beta-helix repeat-containing protein, partial [Thermoplasmata archaeon]